MAKLHPLAPPKGRRKDTPNPEQAKELRSLVQGCDLSDDEHRPAKDPSGTDTSQGSTEDKDVHAWRDPADEGAEFEDTDGEHDDVFRGEDLSELGVEQVEPEQSELDDC